MLKFFDKILNKSDFLRLLTFNNAAEKWEPVAVVWFLHEIMTWKLEEKLVKFDGLLREKSFWKAGAAT